MLATGLLLALATSPTSPTTPAPSPVAGAVELRWDAPAGCPAQAELERQIAALLAGHPPADQRTRVAFRVERRGPQWQLHGEIHGAQASGRRDLQAATCGELVEAAALIVAIAVDPDFVPGDPAVPPPPPPAEPAPESTIRESNTPESIPESIPESTIPASIPESNTPESPPPESLPASPPEPLTTLPAPRPRRPALLLGLSAGLGLGALPAPAGLLRLILGLEGRLWSAALVQDLWLPRVGYVPATTPPASYGGRFWLWSAGLRGCVLAPLGRRLTLPVCATLAAGVHSGTGVGAVTHPQRQVSPWLGLAVGPGLQLRVSPRVRLGLALELLGILARPDFRVSGRGTACCSASVGAQLTLGVAVVLPGRRR